MPKHEWYTHYTGYEIDRYLPPQHRCGTCSVSTAWPDWDQECPNTGAPDWKAIDAKEHEAGMKRFRERHGL